MRIDEIDKNFSAPSVITEPDMLFIAEGDKNVYFVDGEGMYSGIFANSYTVDGVHPNDVGFMHMAEKIGTLLLHSLGFEFNI
ncbi:MAG: hypothetical protein IKT70_02755 [Clostridia bacterium]|nr:hypothetical protein [Clostridia bacterium]